MFLLRSRRDARAALEAFDARDALAEDYEVVVAGRTLWRGFPKQRVRVFAQARAEAEASLAEPS